MDEDGEIYDGRPKGGVENICEILVADIREEDVDFNQYNYARATVYVDFYDCNDKKLSFSGGPTKLARYTIKGAIKASTKELLENIESRMGKYKFDSSRTPPEN